jgi:hypothetical protein
MNQFLPTDNGRLAPSRIRLRFTTPKEFAQHRFKFCVAAAGFNRWPSL